MPHCYTRIVPVSGNTGAVSSASVAIELADLSALFWNAVLLETERRINLASRAIIPPLVADMAVWRPFIYGFRKLH